MLILQKKKMSSFRVKKIRGAAGDQFSVYKIMTEAFFTRGQIIVWKPIIVRIPLYLLILCVISVFLKRTQRFFRFTHSL